MQGPKPGLAFQCRPSQKWREEAKLRGLELDLQKKKILAVEFGHKKQQCNQGGRAGTPGHDGKAWSGQRREPEGIEAKWGGGGGDSDQSIWNAPAPWKVLPTGVSPEDQETPVPSPLALLLCELAN